MIPGSTRLRAFRRAALALLLLLALAADAKFALGPGVTLASASCPGVDNSGGGGLSRISSPSGEPLVSYGVDAAHPARMFVTDGQSIWRTLDGGCSWSRPLFTVKGLPIPTNLPFVGDLKLSDHIQQVVVPPWSGSGPRMVYATLSPCLLMKTNKDQPGADEVPGCGVLASVDDGQDWSLSFALASGPLPIPPPVLTLNIASLTVAPSDPRTSYLLVYANGTLTTNNLLFVSTNGAQSWVLQPTANVVAPLAVDPLDATDVWAAGGVPANQLEHSTDGGATWSASPNIPSVSALDVAHRKGKPAVITVAFPGGGVAQSPNGGAVWLAMPGAPAPVTSIAHGSQAGDLAVTTGPNGPSAGAPWVYNPGAGWLRVQGAFGETQAGADFQRRETFYYNDANIPGVLAYVPPFAPSDAPNDFQGAAQLGPSDGTPNTCFYGPAGKNSVGQTGSGTVAPAPPDEGPIIVDNFDTGCVVGFDRWGHGRVPLQAPQYAEGIALTFDRQLMITTRFSNELTETAFPSPVYVVLDANIPDIEGPSFDRYGNLYVTDNMDNVIYEYPWPQYPGEGRQLVWSFGANHFIEDTRIAPPGSPYAGDLFVEYHNPTGNAADCNGNPDAIAILKRTPAGWTRLPDFAQFPSGFYSLAMAFEPDGSLLVPDWVGSGEVLKYGPRGGAPSVFGSVGTSNGDYGFAKIDIAADGYVYVSSYANAGAAAAGVIDPDLHQCPVGFYAATGARNVIVRFDPGGHRLLPDFTEDLSLPVGIAVPNVITGLPPLFSIPPNPAAALAVPPVPPPNPPAEPVSPTQIVNAPAPGAAPAAQAQPQANPQSQAQSMPQAGMVTQEETRAQLVTVEATTPNGQLQDEPMVAVERLSRDGYAPAAAFVLLASLVGLYFGTRQLRTAGGTQPAHSQVDPPPGRLRGRRRRRD